MRKMSLFLAALLAVMSAVSCGSEGTPDTTALSGSETTTEASEVDYLETLPEVNYDGYEFRIIAQSYDQRPNLPLADEETGEVLNDALYARNVKTAEKYGFRLSDTELPDPKTTMEQQCLAGDSEYDLFLIPLNKLSVQTGKEYLTDFHSVPNLGLTGEWWDQDMLRDLDMGGGQYFMNGDIIFSVYDCLRVIMYSKGLADDLGMSGFYETVRDGKWTVDHMHKLMTEAAADLNSDGATDYQDRFGLLYNNNSYEAYLTSQGVKLISTDGTLGFDTERFIKAYENLLKIFDKTMVFNYNEDKYPGLTARQAIVTLFDNRQALFFENGMSAAAQYMRTVANVDFGFLPLPKLDEEQDKYYSYVSMSAPVLTIPKTNGDRLGDTGFILEALCRESSRSVVPVYFDTCFSAKYTRDEESYEMILLATDSRMYDPGIIYNYGKIDTTILEAAKAGDEAIKSKLDAIKSTVIEEYNKSVG